MREIKFRAWHTHYKRMLAVTAMHFELSGEIECITTFNGDQEPAWRIYQNYTNAEYGFLDSDGEMVLELMQYTGLKDVNGVEIYEGDIAVIDWSDREGESYSDKIVIKNPFEYSLEEAQWINYSNSLKVIGNIYENPELLQNNGVVE